MKVSELKSKLAEIDDDYEIEIWLKEDEDREMLCELVDISVANHFYAYPESESVSLMEISIIPSINECAA